MALTTTRVYPLHALRALALHSQGLTTPLGEEPTPTPDAIYDLVERLTCVQIDTLQMVARAQYIVLWSRMGLYNPADFDQLAYDPHNRRLFEFWQHAACYIPIQHYRYSIPKMRHFQQGHNSWVRNWLQQDGNAELAASILEQVRRDGGVRAAQFDRPGPRSSGWWDWKPAKDALEYLFNSGELMIANRVNFQRVYDLTERVLPEWVDRSEPSEAERDRWRVERGLRALGVCQPAQTAEYAYLGRKAALQAVSALLEQGVAVPIEGKDVHGERQSLVVHRDNLPLLEQAADGHIQPRRTTFLSFFDSLFWARDRDEQFWNYENLIEAYVPAPKRIYGYFCLNILHNDRLVGRFDPKLERKNGLLRLKALYLEPGVEPSEELVADVSAAMRNFLAFHEAKDLVVESSSPVEFGKKLEAAL